MQTQTSNTLHNAIMEAGGKDTLTPNQIMNLSTVVSRILHTSSHGQTMKFQFLKVVLSQQIKRIDNDIYFTVDACLNACEMWKAIERFYKMMNELIRNKCDVTNHQVNVQFLLQLKPEWKRFVTLVSQELKTVSYHKFYDILKQHQNEVNELRAKRIARTANPLALVAQQQPVYHPQNHPTHYTQNFSTRSQQAATRNIRKAIVNFPQPIYDQEPSIVAEDDKTSKDKEIDKLMALISLSFKKIYKPTNNNLRTSSNTSRANQDNSPRINRSTGYENQRIGNVAGARETVEQADWRDDTDDESKDQELEAHYMYMAQIQEVSLDVADSRPIFDSEPVQKVRIVLKCVKITKIRTISTQDQKPQRKARSGSKFSANNLIMKLNLSKVQV
nr:hypothetical protein [Tanacetum cinerariifolium]